MSWARFLSHTHDLSAIESESDVNKILHIEAGLQQLPDRLKYRTAKDLSNFKATLRRFLPFILVWHAQQEALKCEHSFDQMIDQIEIQACSDHARQLFEAIILLAFQRSYLINESQKRRMKESLAKFDCKINADKLFMPGSSCSIHS